MAELYQVATGSKKISNLASISGISGSAVIPVVMSNVVGSSYPITNGTTNQISYQDFRESVIENNANVFTQPQIVQIGSGNSQQRTALVGFEFTMITGSGIGDVSTVAEGLKLEVFGQGADAGVKFFAFDNTEVTPASRFKTFMTLGTGNSNLTLTRNVITTGNLNVAGNLGLGGNLNINQNLIVGGTITAQSYNTEFISASIIYESGSTKFGDTTDDNHERTGYLLVSGSSSVIGNSYVSGIVQNALLGAVTSSLITQNISQNGVNLLISAQTASQGSINTLTFAVTSSLINIVGGLQAYTASLKTAAIVSSSQQILDYNIFATTGSNTFRADQLITGSLSISAGEFNVTTGSGAMTSSLRFDHTQNDGATLQINHDNNTAFADHTFNVTVKSAGVYTEFVRNGTPYSILNVEAFDDNKIYLYRDTRLYNKSLLIDNNLTVTDDAQITGSLIVVGGVTGSLLATNGVVSSSNQLFELNLQTGSQNSVNNLTQAVTASLITIVGGLQAYSASLKGAAIVSSSTQIQNYNLFATTGSNNFIGNQTITGSLTISGSSTFTNIGPTILSGSVNVSGSVNADVIQLGTPSTYLQNTAYWLYGNFNNAGAISFGFSSGNSIANIDNIYINQTSSDLNGAAIVDSLSWINGLEIGSVITIQGIDDAPSNLTQTIVLSVNSITDFSGTWGIGVSVLNSPPTAAAVNGSLYSLTYTTAIGGGLYTISANASRLLVSSSNTQFSGDVNISGSISATTYLGGVVSSSNQLFELNNQTGSQNSINTLTLAVTSSLLSTISGVQSYTASLKGAAIVSSSQQIVDYNLFALTASNNIFYGESSFTNKVTHTNGYVVLQQVSQSLNFVDDTAAAAGGVPLGGLYRNGNFIAIRIT